MAIECTESACEFHAKSEPCCHRKECWKEAFNLCKICKKDFIVCGDFPKNSKECEGYKPV